MIRHINVQKRFKFIMKKQFKEGLNNSIMIKCDYSLSSNCVMLQFFQAMHVYIVVINNAAQIDTFYFTKRFPKKG